MAAAGTAALPAALPAAPVAQSWREWVCQEVRTHYVVAAGVVIAAVLVGGGFWQKPSSVPVLPPAKDMQLEQFCQNTTPPECNVSRKFPLVGQDRFVGALLGYTCEPPKSAFLVWGAMSTGKTAGLRCSIEQWRAAGRMVVNVDLKTRPLEEWPLEQTVQRALAQALHSVNATEWDLGTDVARVLEAELLNMTAVEEKVREGLPVVVSEVAAGAVALLSRLVSVPFESFTQWVARRLPQFLTRAPMKMAVRLLSFVAMYRPEWAPVFVVEEAQALGAEEIEQLLTAVYGHKAGKSRLHVIIETSDCLWAQQQRMVKAAESYQDFQVEVASKEDTRRQLVSRVWTEEEFEKVFAAFGGHGGSLAAVHEKAQARGLDQAIKHHARYWYGLFISRIRESEDVVQPFLVELRKANFSLTMKKPLEHEALRLLVEKNILFLVSNTVSPQHMALQRVIETWLDNFLPLEDVGS